MRKISDPAKWEIEEFLKLTDMVEFLKPRYIPFTAIAREAVNRNIMPRGNEGRLYYSFTAIVHRLGIFEKMFIPYDQSPTKHDRWE